MRRGTFQALLVAGFLVLLGSGCAGSGSPIIPHLTENTVTNSHESCWGIFDVAIDPETREVTFVPVREGMFEANVTKFLQPPIAPVHLLTFAVKPGSDFTTGHVILDVSIQHPFPGTSLRGFDVMGIFMPAQGGHQSLWDPALNWPSANDARLLNPDGYTRWWNQPEFTTTETLFGYQEGAKAVHPFQSTCTLNPYKYFADGIEAEDILTPQLLASASDRGSFDPMTPGICTREYDIQFPMNGPNPDWRFKYGITSSYWGPKEGTIPPAETDDFPLSSNRAEAAIIGITDGGSTAYYENETTYGGDIALNIEILDWQGMVNSDGTPAEIGGVYAESPTLFDGVVDLMSTGISAWEPANPIMMLTGCKIENVHPTGVTGMEILIIVTSAQPSDYSVQLPGISGYDFPESAILAAFTLYDAPISPVGPTQNLPPVADASASTPLEGNAPLEVNLDPSLSYDPDGTIVLYEWDFENDGAFDFSTVAPDVFVHAWTDPGSYQVQLRVTDDGGLSDTLDNPLEITVNLVDDPCIEGPNLLCTGDGNIFVDEYVITADNEVLFTNIINFDLGGPNSQNTIVKYYTGHGGTHNNSPITGDITDLVTASGFTLVDTNEEPIDTTGCRIIFICLPGQNLANPFSQQEYDTLKSFLDEGGRIVLTQEYNDSGLQIQWGNDMLDALGSSIERLGTSSVNQLSAIPNECQALTDGVNETFNPAYTSYDFGSDDMSFIDDSEGYHVLVGDWL